MQHVERPVSIDTSKAEVAEAAIDVGAEIINDVTGLGGDPRMIDVARSTGAAPLSMHMQGTPQTMQDNPHYDDVIAEVLDYLRDRRDALVAAGIERDRICLDPGIGFGKTHEHNLTLLANCWRLHELGCPVLVGHSRKGFIGKGSRRQIGQPCCRHDRRGLCFGGARRANPPRPRRRGRQPGAQALRGHGRLSRRVTLAGFRSLARSL